MRAFLRVVARVKPYTVRMDTHFILGTAGHIDHGKTSLIRALTGVDTDRLPEEKRRGITIDLGFADLIVGPYRLGIVDVPGHERFVRNMLAGATGMDLAMLVVAADDSIKPQTREHLEILRLLDLKAGVIALTKCDLAAGDWIELVEQEIRELVAGTFLADAPLVRTSTTTGQGIDELRARLEEAAERAALHSQSLNNAPLRIPIDRTFTIAGHGTVVTGSVVSGQARIGDELVIEPGGIAVRIRSLQSHDQQVESVGRGQRAAINLAGVHHDAIRRGHELATPGHLAPSKLITAQFSLLPSAAPLRSRTRVRVHVGTAEILASLVLVDRERLLPGEAAPVQLFLAEPMVATWNQPLVVRSESPVTTIGGGRVLDPAAERIRRADDTIGAHLAALATGGPLERAAASLYFAGLRGWHSHDLPRLAGVTDVAGARQALLDRGELREIAVSPTRTVSLHSQVIEQVAARVAALLQTLHDRSPLQLSFPRTALAAGFAYVGDPAVLDAVLATMHAAGKIQLSPTTLSLAGQGPKLSRGEQALLKQLIDDFRAAGLATPSVAECQQKATKNQAAVPQLLSLAAANGELIEVGQGYYLHREAEAAARNTISEKLRGGSGLTLSEIRELLGTTRKYAVPLCEHWDKVGFTTRQGDLRVLA